MKTYKYLVALLLPVVASCESDDVRYHIENPEDQMKITASAEEVVLLAEDADKEVLTFTWNRPASRGEGSVIKPYFRMDIADNNFESATELIELDIDQTSLSFTADDLNDYLLGWGVTPEVPIKVEAEIIATVENPDIYLKPELTKTTLLLTGYKAVSRPLYIVNPAMDKTSESLMEEPVLSKQYDWNGWFDKNIGVKFVYDLTTQLPALTKGADNNTLVKNDTAGGDLFTVEENGYYNVHLNLKNLTCTWTKIYPEYKNLWMVGDACPCGWDIDNSTPMTVSDETPWVFCYDGWLNTGEMKLPLVIGQGWNQAYLMPVIHYSDQNGDDNVQLIPNGNPDYKWYITQAGNYHVEVNIFTMKIKFILQD